STGLKLCGPGEWLIEKHGTKKRRSWHAMHIGMDAGSGRIVAATLTDRGVDDASQVGPLLDQISEPVAIVIGDGAYDRTGVYAAVHERHPDAAVVGCGPMTGAHGYLPECYAILAPPLSAIGSANQIVESKVRSNLRYRQR
ncbi:transposase, partial [Azospirillum sp. TSO5]|uniref:transposase n=1 Tax=Azospirillum sp. TSO5 TaxID=716760 RepID=UPI000D604E93